MSKLLILCTIILSFSTFSQGRPSKKVYDCEVSEFRCEHYNARKNIEITAYSGIHAKNQCQKYAEKENLNYCGVNTGLSGKLNRATEYKCKMARYSCGYDGMKSQTKYIKWVEASSRVSAQQKCMREANLNGDRFCEIAESRIISFEKKYNCVLAQRSCLRPSVRIIKATTIVRAKNVCIKKAKAESRSFCKLTRR